MQCEWSCNVSIFVFFQIAFVFVLGNQDPSTSSLQSDLESEEENGAVLTAKDGTKWKKVQVGEQSTGRLASHNILRNVLAFRVMHVETYRLQVLRVPGFYLLTSLYLNTFVSAPSLKLIDNRKRRILSNKQWIARIHCCHVRTRNNRFEWHAISYSVDWKLGRALV